MHLLTWLAPRDRDNREDSRRLAPATADGNAAVKIISIGLSVNRE